MVIKMVEKKDLAFEILGKVKYKKIDQLPWTKCCRAILTSTYDKFRDGWQKHHMTTNRTLMALVGGHMEETAEELKAITSEVQDATVALQNSFNDVKKTRHILEPEMLEMIRSVRAFRANTTIELNKALSAMREIRKFFFESDYEIEIKRLEKFVSLSERLKSLIRDGTMNAICDVAIKLATQEITDND